MLKIVKLHNIKMKVQDNVIIVIRLAIPVHLQDLPVAYLVHIPNISMKALALHCVLQTNIPMILIENAGVVIHTA